MKQSQLLREIRRIKFEEIYKLRNEKSITSKEAARILCMSERTLRRCVERYKKEGLDGLNDKRTGHASHNAAPVDEVSCLVELYKCHYVGYSVAHFYDKYKQRHGGQRSYNWVKLTLQRQGLMPCFRKKGDHRRKRPRQPLPGMMIRQDVSTHQWVEGKYWDLVVTMDDATNEIYSAFFVVQEGIWSSFYGVKEVIETKGLFCSFYTDRGKQYWITDKFRAKTNKILLIQFERAMKQLGIEMIAVYSPEARGRSKRMFGTLQMRLPLELKSAGINNMDDANRFLKHDFIPEFNRRFCVVPQSDKSVFVPWTLGNIDLDDILCIQDQRIVNNDNTVNYKGKTLQIAQNKLSDSHRKTRVKVNEYSDGRIAIFHDSRKLAEFSAKDLEKENSVGLWMSPADRLAPGMCGKTADFPHSPNSNTQDQ